MSSFVQSITYNKGLENELTVYLPKPKIFIAPLPEKFKGMAQKYGNFFNGYSEDDPILLNHNEVQYIEHPILRGLQKDDDYYKALENERYGLADDYIVQPITEEEIESLSYCGD